MRNAHILSMVFVERRDKRVESLIRNESGCNINCRTMQLGVLARANIHTNCTSIKALLDVLSNIKTPKWYEEVEKSTQICQFKRGPTFTEIHVRWHECREADGGIVHDELADWAWKERDYVMKCLKGFKLQDFAAGDV